MIEIDLDKVTIREFNQQLHDLNGTDKKEAYKIMNPRGKHSVAVGADAPVDITVEGHVGYYCGGMNKHANIDIKGNAGPGVAENIMSGCVRVQGNTSQYAGATGRGGMLVIEGDASSRCGISMKGVDIVVGGSVDNMSAFMGQAGNLVVCGNAGHALGDSLYEVKIYVQGEVKSLGADCVEKEMTEEHVAKLAELLEKAKINADPRKFRRYGSARKLYNFKIDNARLPE
ncbi:GltB/FmdC/FwdC-like GXGXG domain-containing protein [Methylohalomonas lacus]|nr:hypothetical protein [Methylohalomonas lacus]